MKIATTLKISTLVLFALPLTGCPDDDQGLEPSPCGDGVLDENEECDDGNTKNGDGCSDTCTLEECGNGVVEGNEECDDGNTKNGDGCSKACKLESMDECGNGIQDPGETCDDGNTKNGDGCSSTCQTEGTCGDRKIAADEECDDGNTKNGDGCSAHCRTEMSPECGDANLDDGEECDDGGTVDGDGCSASCRIETQGMGGGAGEGGTGPEIGMGGSNTSSGGTDPGSGGTNQGSLGKIIYFTSTPKKANFGGIAAADTECNANRPNDTGTYLAMIVDGTTRQACDTAFCSNGTAENKDWVLSPHTTYVQANGTTVIGTTNAGGVFAFPMDAPFGGGTLSYWTGLAEDWTTSVDTCNGWSGTSGYYATEGLPDMKDKNAIYGLNESCATLGGAVFACVEQ